MQGHYQIDLFDLEDRAYQPITRSAFYMATAHYYCPKCDAPVGFFVKEGKDKGWWEVKDVCKNGHKMNWESIK